MDSLQMPNAEQASQPNEEDHLPGRSQVWGRSGGATARLGGPQQGKYLQPGGLPGKGEAGEADLPGVLRRSQ